MKIKIRSVDASDWDFILSLRNDERFNKFFYTNEQISKKSHYQYMKKQKINPNFSNWIICYGKNDVGYVRILDNDVSIMIQEKYHGQGIGVNTLSLIEIEAKKLGIKKLVGRIMIDNISSKRIFEKNNYKLKMYWLEKEIDN
jgi:RimJ/RimL family protein N-acetyltransferase